MQNPYAVERFIQEHNAHARAVAELQALQRRATAARWRKASGAWWIRVGRLLGRPAARDAATEGSVDASLARGAGDIPFAHARR
jgi:hypothetical protein